MTDEIASRLTGVSGLAVVPSRATRRYAGTRRRMREVGHELGIDYPGRQRTMERRHGSRRVRITLALLRAQDERQLWSTTYDREIADIFDGAVGHRGAGDDRLGVTLRGANASG